MAPGRHQHLAQRRRSSAVRRVPVARTAGARASDIAASARLAGNDGSSEWPNAVAAAAHRQCQAAQERRPPPVVAAGTPEAPEITAACAGPQMLAHRRELPFGVGGRLAWAAAAAIGGDARRCAPGPAHPAWLGVRRGSRSPGSSRREPSTMPPPAAWRAQTPAIGRFHSIAAHLVVQQDVRPLRIV